MKTEEDVRRAIDHLQKMIEIYPKEIGLYSNLAYLLNLLHEYDEALFNLNKAIELDSKSSILYSNRGNVLLEQRKYLKAIEDYTHAIALDPTCANAYYNRGNAYYHLKNDDKAILDYDKALEFSPLYANIYNNRAIIYIEQKNYSKAITNLDRAIELKPDFAYAYLNRGNAHRDQENYDKAIKDYNKAIELDFRYFEAYLNRGGLYALCQNYLRAISDLDIAIQIKPDSADAYYSRGGAHSYLKNYSKSIADLNRAIELNPDHMDAYYYRGYSHFHFLKYKLDYHESDLNRTYTDWNTYIYLSLYNQNPIRNIPTLISFFQSYPLTVQILLKYWEIDKEKTTINNFERPINLINDFTLLLQYYEKAINDANQFLAIKAILSYYLGGSISAFKIFDEQLDDGDHLLSSQELYYFALTAQEINREASTILRNSIEEISNKKEKDAIDYYYLGHLYILQEDTKKAIENFESSDNFIFSKIMLAFLLDENNLYLNQLREISIESIYNFSRYIDFQKEDLSQFQCFFHLQECKDALHSFEEDIAKHLVKEEFQASIWEVFKLSSTDKEYINESIRRIDAENILNKMQEAFASTIEKEISGKKEIFTNEIIKKLCEKEKGITDIFDYLDRAISKNRDIENQIGLLIKEWEYNNPKIYLYLIQLYYLNGNVNSKEVFTLYFYLIYTIKKKKEIQLEIDNLFFEIGKSAVSYVGIKLFLIASKTAWSIVKKVLEEYDDFNIDTPSEYRTFKENFWKYIAHDKETLSKSDFENKYISFEWLRIDN